MEFKPELLEELISESEKNLAIVDDCIDSLNNASDSERELLIKRCKEATDSVKNVFDEVKTIKASEFKEENNVMTQVKKIENKTSSDIRALLIDDSPVMRKLQKSILATLAITNICEARSGEKALEILAKDSKFDFIMCDINMGGMDGIVTVREIKKQSQIAHIPIIMCTSIREKAKVVAAIKAGASKYITKPFTTVELKKQIESLIV